MNGNIPNRRNWSNPLTFVTALSVVAVIIGYLADGGAGIEDRLFFQNSGGPILFDHGMHSETTETCSQCHHELFSADPVIACSQCHDDLSADEFSHSELKEMHAQECSRCHSQDEDKVPTDSCRTCHVKMPQGENNPSDCSRCHDEGYTADMVSHDEYLEVEEHSCLGCHSPASVAETYHLICTNCHLDIAPERFATNDGGPLCGACHLR